ncbi:tetratricopeptide repeat protein [Anabaena subtropica]|uniref:Tetratricopeptide repeat protein n=1 Tax=Anabaena subtropica FACHB-260 TaxID=2692884 RepID=A0ABR8CVQ1_9NOST|nr:tetratricopeptide repeat protein [Anabaena subtropica]MBD2347282.1 tetratricopeptide repeat protein [Anabaena subtropica FACHB-260]
MTEVTPHPECPFSHITFELLQKIKKNSVTDFYLSHKKDFQDYIENPFETIYNHLIAQLPLQIIEKVNVNTNLTRLTHGNGVISYRFTPKESTNKFSYINLFISIDDYELRSGLIIHEFSEAREKFIENLKIKKVKEIILQHLHPIDDLYLRSESNTRISRENRLSDWLGTVGWLKSATKNIQVSKHLRLQEVLSYSSLEIIEQIRQTLGRVFILFLVATEDDPIRQLKRYILKEDLRIANNYFDQGLKIYYESAYTDAIIAFDLAIQNAPNLADPYKYRGKVKAKLEDINGAILDYNQLLLINPKNADAYYSRGHFYCKLDAYDKAIYDYSQAILINPNYSLAYYHRGCAYLEFSTKLKAVALEIYEFVAQSSGSLFSIFGIKQKC